MRLVRGWLLLSFVVSVGARSLLHQAALSPDTTVPSWEPNSGASGAVLERSLVHLGSAKRLVTLVASGATIRVAALGSSVTGTFGGCTTGISPLCDGRCGGDCGAPVEYTRTGWLRKVADAIDRGAIGGGAGRNATLVYNSGFGGGSLVHASDCLDTSCPHDADVVVIELATYLLEQAAALEHILRLLATRESPPTVILLRTITTWRAAPAAMATNPALAILGRAETLARPNRGVLENGPERGSCERAQLEGMAQHYGITLVDQYEAICGAAAPSGAATIAATIAGRSAFYSFEGMARDAAAFTPAKILTGSIHPNSRGIALLSDLLIHATRRLLTVRPSQPPSPDIRRRGAALQLRSICYSLLAPETRRQARRLPNDHGHHVRRRSAGRLRVATRAHSLCSRLSSRRNGV